MSKLDVKHLLDAAREIVKKKYRTFSEEGTTALHLPNLWISTGALSLDRICTGRNPGGIPIGPTGRVVHVAGEWSTGKSLILDHLFKSVQDLGGIALLSETEGSRDPHFSRAIGIDLERLEAQRPETLEELFDAGLAWHDNVRESKEGKDIPILWGIDSLDSTESEKSASKGMTEGGGWHFGGGKSEALGAGLRKVVQRCSRFPTSLVMLNQTRENVGVLFGPKKITPGGNAPHFYASLELMLTVSSLGVIRDKYKGVSLPPERRKQLGLKPKEEGDIVARWIHAKVTKTKVAPTFAREADFIINFYTGIDPFEGLLPLLIDEGKLTIEGRMIKYQDECFSPNNWSTWIQSHQEVLG